MKRLKRENEIHGLDIRSSYKEKVGSTPLHCHDFFEIEYFAEGSGVHNMDGAQSDITDGMLYFMTPASFHGFETDGSCIYNTMFSEKLCNSDLLARLIDGGMGFSVRLAGEDKIFIESLFRELGRARGDGYLMTLIDCVLGKLLTLKGDGRTAVTPISKSVVYITEHFCDSCGLEEVAEYVGFTPTYFSSLFKKEMGISYKEYLDRLRFGHAKKLLEHTDKSIVQICRECGFNDYPNFIRRFRAKFRKTPGEMRKNR